MQEFTGQQYLKIDVANAFGKDKLTWQQRLDWFDMGNTFDLSEAEDVFLAEKGINAYMDAIHGTPTGHVMYFDATASGLQIMACLMGCEITAAEVNLIDTGSREDAYTNVTNVMNEYVTIHIDRKTMKEPTMTRFYGSKAKPKEVFGENTVELEAFYKALADVFPGACEYLDDVQSCWQGDAEFHQWTMPDGSVIKVKVRVEEEKKIEVDELGCVFTHRCEVNKPSEYGVSLAANIVQGVDAWIVDEMKRRAKAQGFELLCIFDAFGASPNWMNNVRRNYIDILAELAEMDLLSSILSEITGESCTITGRSTDLPDLIRASEYPLS